MAQFQPIARQPLRILVTRPRGDATRTAARLEALGHVALVSPVLERVATGATWPAGVIAAVLATSAAAFDFLTLGPDWPPAETRRLLPLRLVGDRTLAAARARGFTGPDETAVEVKDQAPKWGEIAARPGRLLYLAGRDRKGDLEETLSGLGAHFEVVEVYAAEAAKAFSQQASAALRAGTLDAVLHYSARSAEIFATLAAEEAIAADRLRHICISAEAARPLDRRGVQTIMIASEPREAAMLACLSSP